MQQQSQQQSQQQQQQQQQQQTPSLAEAMPANPKDLPGAIQQTQPQAEAMAAAPNDIAAAMQQSQSWHATHLAAAQAAECLEGIPSEINSYIEAALCSVKADLAAAAEAAVAAAAIQSMSAPEHATQPQVSCL